MNVQTKIIEAIQGRLLETKNPCKVYKTEASADKAGKKMSQMAGEYFDTAPAHYMIVNVPGFGFTPAFDMSEMMRREDFGGGYIFFISSRSFYTY